MIGALRKASYVTVGASAVVGGLTLSTYVATSPETDGVASAVFGVCLGVFIAGCGLAFALEALDEDDQEAGAERGDSEEVTVSA